MKKLSKRLLANIICSIILITNIVCFILLNINLHKTYEYFVVTSYVKMILLSFRILLPSFVSLFAIILYKKLNKFIKKIFITLIIISIILSFIFIITMSVLSPCGSFTQDKNNYLKFDISCPLSENSYSALLLPSIPKNAKNVKYVYDYYNNPDTRYDVFLQITLPLEEYEEEKQRLLSNFKNISIESYGIYDVAFISDENKTKLDQAGFGYSDEYLTIRYFVSFIDNVDINEISPYYKNLTW